MVALDFIARWQARPFQPFTLRLSDGRTVAIDDPARIATTPDLTQFVVMTPQGPELFGPGDIQACLPANDPLPAPAATPAPAILVPPAIFQPPKFDSGHLTIMAFTTTEGDRLTHFVLSNAQEQRMLTTVGTRWDFVGVERFENGQTLHLVHLDDPTRILRVIAWPPETATLESFAEARPCPDIQARLLDLDAQARAAPRNLEPDAAYWRSIKPREAYTPPKPRYFRGEEEWDEPPNTDAPAAEAFKVRTRSVEWTPGASADEVALQDARGRDVFDLTGVDWFGRATLLPGVWQLDVWRGHAPQSPLSIQVWPGRALAQVAGLSDMLPMAFVERTLRNVQAHGLWDLMLASLRANRRPHNEPESILTLPGDERLELWSGDSGFLTPFLQPRLVRRGRAVFDLRGSVWSAWGLWQPSPGLLRLSLTAGERSPPLARSTIDLELDLPTSRLHVPGVQGQTATSLLHIHAHATRTTAHLRERLTAACERGAGIIIGPRPAG